MKRGDPTTQPRLSLTLSHSQDKMAQAFLAQAFLAQAFLDHDPKQDGGKEDTVSVQNLQEYTQYTLHQACDTNICNTLLLFIYCLFESIASESSIHQFNSHCYEDPHIPYMNLIRYNWCVY